ncbi:MAG TPA: ATP-dependent helicase HrpB [Bryobacteraceae bacterium]|nr:ATP-dependent helicase HrpB [Bryobacteraceae bacterium]
MSTALPIDPLIPAVLEELRKARALVLEAPPGAGKTTRVPPAVMREMPGEVLVLEPRRLAARLAARRVAFELGERVGETVGYQVRFEEAVGPQTRLKFMTEGVLTRRLLSDPELRGVSAVLLDEFHERHLEGDTALALLRRLQEGPRRDLRLVVMSATIETAPVAEYLGGCPVLRSAGRQYELSIAYRPSSPEPLEQQVAASLETLLRDGLDGDVLVFLPGAAEIRRAARACERLAQRAGLLLLPLHGDLPPEEQERALAPADRPKVILSTNVAESSVTIEGVTAVIDSGLARVASQSPWSGLPRLTVSRISKASANQRAGRAGRTRPGRVIRLYPAEDFHRRPAQDVPEIARVELTQLVLTLAAMGVRPAELQWLEKPPEAAVEAAGELLRRLGAMDENDRLTPGGRRMAAMPVHPRLARLILEAADRGAAEDGCALAALLSSGERLPRDAEHAGPSDLLLLLETDWEPRTRRLFEQIRRFAPRGQRGKGGDEALLMAVLAAFPDRVARRRKGNDLLLASGGSAVLSPSSVVRNHEFLVAVDLEERSEHGLPLVRLASGIEPEWLLDLFPERVTERRGLEWNRAAERVEESGALLYDKLVIEESRGAPRDSEQAARLLAEKALDAGIARFCEPEELEQFLARTAFASEHTPLVRELGEEDVRAALASLCHGLASFAELENAARKGGLLRALEAGMPADARRALEEYAPARLRLPNGRSVKVNYARGRTPWIAAKLQEFFGMQETPRIARGKAPVVVHLLAPNNRPVQTTTDLAGFWERLYPAVRRELSRRYPRHRWPEMPGP